MLVLNNVFICSHKHNSCKHSSVRSNHSQDDIGVGPRPVHHGGEALVHDSVGAIHARPAGLLEALQR